MTFVLMSLSLLCKLSDSLIDSQKLERRTLIFAFLISAKQLEKN